MADGCSPLVYNANSKLIENTPQVHKRKASFKMVKSVTSKQDEFGTFTSSVLDGNRYSGAKPRDASHVKSIEAGGSSGTSGSGKNLHNLLSTAAIICGQSWCGALVGRAAGLYSWSAMQRCATRQACMDECRTLLKPRLRIEPAADMTVRPTREPNCLNFPCRDECHPSQHDETQGGGYHDPVPSATAAWAAQPATQGRPVPFAPPARPSRLR